MLKGPLCKRGGGAGGAKVPLDKNPTLPTFLGNKILISDCPYVNIGLINSHGPPRRNWKLTLLPRSDTLIHLLLSETILSSLPLLTSEFPL